jgi:hypothetical protein
LEDKPQKCNEGRHRAWTIELEVGGKAEKAGKVIIPNYYYCGSGFPAAISKVSMSQDSESRIQKIKTGTSLCYSPGS